MQNYTMVVGGEIGERPLEKKNKTIKGKKKKGERKTEVVGGDDRMHNIYPCQNVKLIVNCETKVCRTYL